LARLKGFVPQSSRAFGSRCTFYFSRI
jgi:hypothetical protein